MAAIVVSGPSAGAVTLRRSPAGIDADFTIALPRGSADVRVLYRLRVKEPSITVSRGYYGLLGADASGAAAPSLADSSSLHAGADTDVEHKLSKMRVEFVLLTPAQAAALAGKELDRDSCGALFGIGTQHVDVPCALGGGGGALKVALGLAVVAAVAGGAYAAVKSGAFNRFFAAAAPAPAPTPAPPAAAPAKAAAPKKVPLKAGAGANAKH